MQLKIISKPHAMEMPEEEITGKGKGKGGGLEQTSGFTNRIQKVFSPASRTTHITPESRKM